MWVHKQTCSRKCQCLLTESLLKMSPDQEWKKLHTTQFNSVKPIGRLAYMKISGMPVAARDLYRDGYGEMNVKLMNLIKVAFDNSKEVLIGTDNHLLRVYAYPGLPVVG